MSTAKSLLERMEVEDGAEAYSVAERLVVVLSGCGMTIGLKNGSGFGM